MDLTLKQTGSILTTIKDWLMKSYEFDCHDARLISYWLFHFSYRRLILSDSICLDCDVVKCLIKRAKEIALERINQEKLLELAVPFE